MRLHRLAFVPALCLLAQPAWSTWSIVAVRRSTGEVAVASATCLTLTDLQATTPALVVGRGAAAVQASGDRGGDRRDCAEGFRAGLTPQEILANIEARHPTFSQQFGIVSFDGPPLTFSGVSTGEASFGVSGELDGDILYAIQGNVLTGDIVVTAAEEAFSSIEGDLVDRMMAGMKAARSFGGDGRCSCRPQRPTLCGAPPANFEKSAHVGYMIVARVGDMDGTCRGPAGCANGDYFYSVNVIGNEASLDPVLVIDSHLGSWRQNRVGRPDHIHSMAKLSHESLPADGTSRSRVAVQLKDINGDPLRNGDARVQVRLADGPARHLGDVGPVRNHGDGTYSFDVIAGNRPGVLELEIRADDGTRGVTLFPFPKVELRSPSTLTSATEVLDPTRTNLVSLELRAAHLPGSRFLLVGSASGRVPGTTLEGRHVPLNRDLLFERTLARAGRGPLAATAGVLDGSGAAEIRLRFPASALLPRIGRRLDWVALLLDERGVLHVSEPLGFDIVP